MARFYGKIGFAINEEIKPGVYAERYEERYYKGELLKRNRQWEPTEYLNDRLNITNEISIISDSFSITNFGVMRYVRFNKQTFEITSATIDTERHRIILSLGGIFNVPDDD